MQLDFFSMEKEYTSSDPKLYPTVPKLECGITFREIGNGTWKTDLNKVLETEISTGSANAIAANKSTSLLYPSTPRRADCPMLPVFIPTSTICYGSKKRTEVEPLTIFYNGTVAVFDVTSDKVDDILKFAERSKSMNSFSLNKQLPVETLMGDISLARRNSLNRFLEKRKERICCGSKNGTKIVSLTISFDGTIAVYEVSSDKAEDIRKLAERSNISDVFLSKKQLSVETLSGDIPLARRNSLIRFRERRKERLCCGSEISPNIVHLTIFYDGKIAGFDVSNDKAEDILKFAERSQIGDVFSSRKQLFVKTLSGDLPLARKYSLDRFMEKRKERLSMVSPYGFPEAPIYGSLRHTASGNKN